MKKLLVAVMVVALGFAFNAYAADTKGTTEVKSKTETTAGETKTKTEIKDTSTGLKAKEETVTKGDTTTTKTEVKGKNVDIKRETTDTAKGETGKMKTEVKKGAIKDLEIEWTYRQEGNDYITEYTIKKEKINDKLMKELNLTPDQLKEIKPGTHTITSTSPYTAEDVRSDLRAVILKDIKSSISKK